MSIQKVLLDYDEFLRLKDIEARFQVVSSENSDLRKKLGTIL